MGAQDNQNDDLELARAMLDRLTRLFDDELTPAHVVEKLPSRIKELRQDIQTLESLSASPAPARDSVVDLEKGRRFKAILEQKREGRHG